MKLGDVLKKERERKKLSLEDVATELRMSLERYEEFEGGESPIEEWGPKLADIAVKLSTPTSRLICDTGKSVNAGQSKGQCGQLIKKHREKRNLTQEELAKRLGWPMQQLDLVESGKSDLEQYAPLLLRFAEVVDQPIFNLFFPCGLPFAEIKNYP